MIALDTNVLVRYVVEDDPRQSALATALIHRAIASDESLFVSDIVVCETVWVLRISYHIARAEIATLLRSLFRARHLAFRAANELQRALDAYENGKGDFADYLIREHGRSAEYESVATFDKVLLKERGFIAAR
ncbi:MAG: type II toxin-antitoxin system VapC family toxin [Gemmatimonadota bacterium]|nr:type II toxin-antitoxin system VapC family toxin [Gemmatimonadota bacterium]